MNKKPLFLLLVLLLPLLTACFSEQESPTEGRLPEAKLATLTLSSGGLTPAFDPLVTVYTATTTLAQVTLSALADNPYAQVTVNGGEAKNSVTTAISLTNGINAITIMVRDENGHLSASRLYSIQITRTVTGPQLLVFTEGVPLQHNSTNDFGTVGIGTTNTLTLTISNGGSEPLSFPAGPPRAILTGSNAFLLTADLPATLAPGTATQLTLQVAPEAAGSISAVLSISNNDTAAPFTLNLLANGLAIRQTIALWGFDNQDNLPTEGAGVMSEEADIGGSYFTINGYEASGGNPGEYAKLRRLHATAANYMANDSFIQLQVDLTGATDPRVSFDLIREDGTVYDLGFAVGYSTDGALFTELAGSTTALSTTDIWQTVSWEGFPGALNGEATVYFRIYGWGSGNYAVTFGLDTIKIEAYK